MKLVKAEKPTTKKPNTVRLLRPDLVEKRKLIVYLHAALSRARMPVRMLVLLAGTAATFGCAGGPKLDVAKSNWPGATQISNAGKRITGLLKRTDTQQQEDKTRRQRGQPSRGGKAAVRNLAGDNSTTERPKSPAATDDDREIKSRILAAFSRQRSGDDRVPQDPFLAQPSLANEYAKSPSPTPNIAGAEQRSTISQTAADELLRAVAASRSIPSEKTPEKSSNTPRRANPFAELTDSEPAQSVRRPSTAPPLPSQNTFVDGFDWQLDRVRQNLNDDSKTTGEKLTETPSVDSDLLRRMITGSAKPSIAKPFPEEFVADTIPEEATNTVVPSLPEWALPTSPKPEPEKPQAAVVARPTIAARPTEEFDPAAAFASSVRALEQSKPSASAFNPIVNQLAEREPTFTASTEPWSDADPGASARVELLPRPVESKGDFGGMIVESAALSPGFAEWRHNGERAVVRTNSPIRRQSAHSSADDLGWTLPAANSQRSWGSRLERVDANQAAFTDIGSQYEEPAEAVDLLPHATESAAVEEFAPIDISGGEEPKKSAGTTDTEESDVQPRLLLFTEESADPGESSLETVNWPLESEPGSEKAWFDSRAVLGLMIGLACLIGLGLFRRKYAHG